jgi:hypothetical protein
MNKDKILKEIKDKNELLRKIELQRSESKDNELLNKLIQEQLKLSREISDLEWELFSKEEKQNYREMILNVAKKHGTVNGSLPLNEKVIMLEKIISIYNLSNELIGFEELPNNIFEKIVLLQIEIDACRNLG